MKYCVSVIIVLFLGCAFGEKASSGPSSSSKKELDVLSSIEGTSKVSESGGTQSSIINRDAQKEWRFNFGGENWIDVDIKFTRATILNHVRVFSKPATFYLGTWSGTTMKSHEKLKEFCEAFSVKKIPREEMFGGIDIFLNPLHDFILPKIALKYLHETITSVENPFVIAKKAVEIEADFLDAAEKNQIIQEGSLERFDRLDHLRISLFNPILEPGPELSSLLARLFCGIADNKASILYTFHNQEGDELLVRISGVVFEAVDY